MAVACCSPILRLPESALAYVAPGALVIGMALALSIGNPYPDQSKTLSKYLLQAAVVLLGFSMDLQKVFEAGKSGLVFALVSIFTVFLFGALLQRWLGIRIQTSLLVCTGTAICGGSAIAAMSSVLDSPQEDVSVSVGTVFLLNAIALMIFPVVGHIVHLTPDQFGTWSGIAIHDISSVVGAATAFGGGAVQTAAAVKLSRVLYLVPITLVAAFFSKRGTSGGSQGTVHIPWFVGMFILASILSTYCGPVHSLAPSVRLLAISGFSLSLFLIGGGITGETLKAVGVRPLLQGVVLWLFISVASLLVVMRTSSGVSISGL